MRQKKNHVPVNEASSEGGPSLQAIENYSDKGKALGRWSQAARDPMVWLD